MTPAARPLVDIMACYLIPRHGAKVMELYVSRDQPDDESTLDILKRAIKKKAIPLQPRSRSPRQRRRPAASNREPALRNRAFLGPRRNPQAGTKLILIPALTWESGRLSPLLSELCPKSEDQIDKSVPPIILKYLAESKVSTSVVTFSEKDAIDRLQYEKDDCLFPWKHESEWKNSIGNAATARKYLDVVYLTTQNGEIDAEEQVIANVHLPDSNSELHHLKVLYSGSILPSGLQNKQVGPILHHALVDHRLLRRQAWKPKPFTFDNYLDHADLANATVDHRKSFSRWIRENWRQVRPRTLRRLGNLPVWPNTSGCPRRLDELCEPANRRVVSIMGNALDRPSGDILRSRMVKTTGRGALALRRVPRIEEVEEFLSTRLATFSRDRTLSREEKKDFRELEGDLSVLAAVSPLKDVLEELCEEYGVALNGEGFLKNAAELVGRQSDNTLLHLPARHAIDRSGSILDRVTGWAAKSEPSTSQIRDALREDSGRTEAHVRRLQEYAKQSENEGAPPNGILDLRCIPVEETLYSPSQLSLRGRRDFWGSWKTRIPLNGISAEV